MTFSERLQALIDRNGSDQRDLAVAWHARWQKLGHKGWSPAHVESSLSRCAQGKAPGIRFFFEEAARGGLLLDMLGATEAERGELVAGAAAALGPMGSAPRLVVDFTPWSSREEPALFRAAEELFLTLGSLFPAAFVVTAEQYRQLPITFTDHRERLRIETVENAEVGWAVVEELAGKSALVAASRRFPVFERWLALELEGTRLLMEPEDVLDDFAESGGLPALPMVVHDVADLGLPAERATLPRGPRAVRRLIWNLAHEGLAEGPPAQRAALAARLGVRAASTEGERIEAALRAAGLKWQPATDGELRELLGRAARRPVPPAVLRVGDLWHLVNVEPPASLRVGPTRLQLHRVACKPTALRRLTEACAAWTADDWATDPRMERLLARLDPKSEETAAFLHARAWRSLAGGFPVAPPQPASDWRSALTAILAGPAPAAELRIAGAARQDGDTLEPFLTPGPDAGGWTRRILEQIPVSGPFILARGEPLTGVEASPAPPSLASVRWMSPSKIGRAANVGDEGAWLDNFERGTPAQWLGQGVAGDRGTPLQMTELTPAPGLWREADRALALLWRALRRAAGGAGDAEALHDGRVLLPLGGGLFAEISVRVHPAAAAPRGALEWRVTRGSGSWSAEPAESFGSGPRGATLLGHGHAADVSFVVSPYGS